MKWLLDLLTRAFGFFATWMWARKKAQNEIQKQNAKAMVKEAQNYADAPHTDDDFHDRMRKRIRDKD
jgi:hypothetical protein